jgi:hypothetical protein
MPLLFKGKLWNSLPSLSPKKSIYHPNFHQMQQQCTFIVLQYDFQRYYYVGNEGSTFEQVGNPIHTLLI